MNKMKNKKKLYGVFIIRNYKNKYIIEGVCKNCSYIDYMNKTIKSIKRLTKLKNGKIIPVRVTRNNLPLPIEVHLKSNSKGISLIPFNLISKVERRKFKLNKLCSKEQTL